MLARYLRDRLGLICAYGISTLLVLTLMVLLMDWAPALIANIGYALLLSAMVLVIYLALDYLRRRPFLQQVEHLLAGEDDLDLLSLLPPGADAEQNAYRELLAKVYQAAVRERDRYQASHRQHLMFINLWVHQMKTPVSAISLIAQEEAARGAGRQAMQSVEEETARLAEGLDLVLNLARLDSFAQDYQIRRVDLLQTVRGVINARKKQFIRLSIFPEVEADPAADWTVLTDEKWNGFVIDQIVSNALKYGAQGGAPGQRLRFLLTRAPRQIALSVKDQGPGIPETDLPRIFEPFFTGENGRRFANATGIGLYMVRQVTERLGHAVEARSTPGAGTELTVTYNLSDL